MMFSVLLSLCEHEAPSTGFCQICRNPCDCDTTFEICRQNSHGVWQRKEEEETLRLNQLQDRFDEQKETLRKQREQQEWKQQVDHLEKQLQKKSENARISKHCYSKFIIH